MTVPIQSANPFADRMPALSEIDGIEAAILNSTLVRPGNSSQSRRRTALKNAAPIKATPMRRLSRLLKNSLLTQPWMAATTKQARKRLIRREPVRTCAGLAT
jgi:hypothetical protein